MNIPLCMVINLNYVNLATCILKQIPHVCKNSNDLQYIISDILFSFYCYFNSPIVLLLTEELSERHNTTTEQSIELCRIKEQILALKRELEIAGKIMQKMWCVIKNGATIKNK